jgi:hypothetical protein
MGKNMKFKPILVKVAVDSSGRRMTIEGSEQGLKMQDELNIQVEDKDNKFTMMWDVEEFKDKLEMMRQAFNAFQDKQMQKTHDEKTLKMVDKQLFNTN